MYICVVEQRGSERPHQVCGCRQFLNLFVQTISKFMDADNFYDCGCIQFISLLVQTIY